MLGREENIRQKTAISIAERMATAARTAPKGKGRDTLKIFILTDEEKNKVADQTEAIGKRLGTDFFIRDAACVRKANALLLIGTSILPEMLSYCGLCGFKDCKDKMSNPLVPCVFNSIDLGIAVGSAVSVAADCRVDSRVLYTVAMGAMETKVMGDQTKIILGIPISISGKSPFFDR